MGIQSTRKKSRRPSRSWVDSLAARLPAEGLEPTRSCDHWILSPARLPVPPRRLAKATVSHWTPRVQVKLHCSSEAGRGAKRGGRRRDGRSRRPRAAAPEEENSTQSQPRIKLN